jgi:CubicO group peptidase (beta-lactamase class C family)
VFVDQSDGTAPWTTGTPESQGLDPAKLLAGVDAVKGDRDIRAVLVIRNGVLVYEGYFHGAGIATALPLHSASKAHLALGCCMAVDEGKLASLDVPVAEVIPRFFPSTRPTICGARSRCGICWGTRPH